MRRLRNDQLGQATAEYALVMLAAAAVAVTLIVWATTSGVLPEFFSAVIKKVTSVANGTQLG